MAHNVSKHESNFGCGWLFQTVRCLGVRQRCTKLGWQDRVLQRRRANFDWV